MSACAHCRPSQSQRRGLFGCVRFVAFLFAGFPDDSSMAGERADMLDVYGSEQAISIATGYTKPLARAPGVGTVITAADIEATGATTLDQVLSTVPGLHVSTARGIVPIASLRGISSELDPGTLVMINGIPVAQSLTNSFIGFYALPVNNIARVEIIRGPGSAVYGADAFAGVINVVTKTNEGLRQSEIGARVGYFDAYEGWLLHGARVGAMDVALGLTGQTTDGYDTTIEADTQTTFDRLLGTRASLAPSRINTGRDIMDFRLDIARDPLRARVGYFNYDSGTGVGLINALDPQGNIRLSQFSTDLTYRDRLSPVWDVTAQVSYFDTENVADTVILPPGAVGGAFPEGVLNDLRFHERQVRTEMNALYSGFPDHLLRGGVGFYYTALDEVEERRNLFLSPNGLLVPAGRSATTRELGVASSVPEVDREVYYGFLQDEWRFAPDWAVTAGVRYDGFSDSGVSGNPRVSLVWNLTRALTAKLLYGRAFRAPSFLERFARNNLLALGNSNLDAETIDTAELAFVYTRPAFEGGINIFGYEIHDPIALIPNQTGQLIFSNGDDRSGYGLEADFVWDVTERLKLKWNYAFQEAEESTSVPLSPRHQVYAEGLWAFAPGWSFDVSLKAAIDRDRINGDPRQDLEDYTLVKLSLRRKNVLDHVDVAVTVRNLFDVDAREPSISATNIPNDVPLADRNLYGEIRIHFQ